MPQMLLTKLNLNQNILLKLSDSSEQTPRARTVQLETILNKGSTDTDR